MFAVLSGGATPNDKYPSAGEKIEIMGRERVGRGRDGGMNISARSDDEGRSRAPPHSMSPRNTIFRANGGVSVSAPAPVSQTAVYN